MDLLRGFGEACRRELAFDPISLRSQAMQQNAQAAGQIAVHPSADRYKRRSDCTAEIGFEKTTVADNRSRSVDVAR